MIDCDYWVALFLACFLVVRCSIYKGYAATILSEISCVKKKADLAFFMVVIELVYKGDSIEFFWELGISTWVEETTSSLLESSLFNIEKLDGTSFPFWKEKIYNVLVQKKQMKPIKLMGVKPEAMG